MTNAPRLASLAIVVAVLACILFTVVAIRRFEQTEF
jgi:hypothetical protein